MKGSRTLRVQPPAERDWRGDPLPDLPEPYLISGVAIVPHDSDEDGQEYVTSDEDAFVMVQPARVPTAVDSVEVVERRGDAWVVSEAYPGRWELVGRPRRLENARGKFKALRLSLQQVGTGEPEPAP